MGIKRQRTSPNDVEVVPVFEFHGSSYKNHPAMLANELLAFVEMVGTNRIVCRDNAYPDGHAKHEYYAHVDVDKVKLAATGSINGSVKDLDKLVAEEKARQADKEKDQKEKAKKKDPRKAYYEGAIREEMEKGASDMHKDSYEGE